MLNFFRNSSILSRYLSGVSISKPIPATSTRSHHQQCGIVRNSLCPNNDNCPTLRLGEISTRLFGSLSALQPPTLTHRTTPILVNNANSSVSVINGANFPVSGFSYTQVRGMKYMGRVKRRCKDCFLMWINGQLYNLCKTHPRHKHGLKQPYFVNQRILTHATQGKRKW